MVVVCVCGMGSALVGVRVDCGECCGDYCGCIYGKK